jgi:hypothetical protein
MDRTEVLLLLLLLLLLLPLLAGALLTLRQ